MGAVQDFKDLLARYNAVMSRASYGFNGEKVTASKRQRANDAAIAILDRVNRGEQITAADKLALSRYTGQGGNLEGHDGSTGSPYEYYTPKVVASAMWDLMAQYGSAGKVLDPCSGTGIFGATAPTGVLMHSVELSPISGQINGIVNGSDTHRVTVAPFEQVAGSTEDETFDSVITNVPFGTNAMRGANLQLDSKYQQDSLEEYFILRSLDKLKAGGLAMFITPAKIMTGNSFSKFRTRFLLKADLIGAYRLPNKVFDETGADVTTDILLFRKHSKDLQAKIKDCYDNGNVTVLTESRVLDTDIVAGKYFQHEGKRFVLGKSEVGKGRYGEVERIVNDDSVANIMKAVKKFPDSRIEYAALELAEVPYVEYKNGDIQVMDGATFEYKDGQWVQGEAVQFDESLFVDPYAAFMAGVTETRMNAYFGFKTSTGKKPEKWTAQLRDEAAQAKAEGAFGYYLCCMSVVQLIANGLEKDVNYQQKYPELTNYMIGIADDFNANKYKPKGLKSLMKRVSVAFDRGNQNGLSDAWLGLGTAIDKLNMQTGVKGVYEKLVYTGQADADFSVSVASIQQLQPDFNPLTDAEYCINADGSRVTHSKDYYSGNYAEFLARINADLESATDLDIRAKLIAQRDGAKAHIKDVDVTKLNYNLKSTTVSNDLKVEFLSDYLSRNISLNRDGEFEYTGKKPKLKEAYDQFGYGGIDSNQVIEFFANRICVMLNGNAGLSLGFSVNSGITNEQHDKLHAIFKSRFDELDVTFATWLKSNIGYMANLDASINAPENKTFNLQLDDAPIEIDGFAPKLNGFVGMNSYQNEEIRRLSRRFEGICGFDVGLGKAQPLTSKILTPTGWVAMGDIQVGDLVISQNGKPTKVIGVFPQGKKEIFEVTFSDGAKTQCCNEHLWLTKTESDRKKERYAKKMGGDRNIEGTVKTLAEIKNTLIYQTQKNHQIPMVSPVDFAAKDFKIDPYFLGVVIGDGSMSHKTVSICSPDEPIVKRIKQIVADDFAGEIYVRDCIDGDRAPQYFFSRIDAGQPNPIAAQFDLLGLRGKKSPEKFIPKDYLIGSIKQRIDLLHGLMDTDGYVSKDGVTTQYFTSSVQLADDIIALVQGLGGIAWSNFKETSYKKNGVKIDCLGGYTVSIRLPDSINPFFLDRKRDRVKPKTKYKAVRYIVNVQSVGHQQAQCISVDHPSHLYVTDHYIVTHNTLTALATVQNMHNIGVKKRTFIVVPKHTISKWAGDMKMAYDNTDDVLVIGSNGNKLGKASSAYYAADFNLLLKKPYRKVLMTSDAFTAIPIQANSVERYQDLASVKNKTEQIKQEGQQAKLVKDMQVNKDKYPFFEELQVDSLVFDEAQMFKNGKAGEGAFNRVKGMSLLSESALAARALSASIKSWLVRGTSPQKDGVLLLTATPFTNGPIEIITMLSLAVGDDAAKKLLGGSNIKSTDDFLSTFARIDGVDALNIAGRVTTADTFIGFTNVAMLKDAIHTVANIQTGRERGLKMPDQNDITVSLNLAENDKQTLNLLKAAYLAAKTSVKDGYGALMPHQQEALDAAMAITGDSDDRLAHPFNLISHMSNVILCGADMAMNRTVTINYNPLQTKEAAAVEKAFNAKKNTVDTERRYPKLDPKFLVKVTTKDLEDVADGVSSNEKYKILAQVELDDDAHTLTLNIDDSGALAKLIIACEKAGLELRPTVSAKVMAMLDNFKAEMANPMHNGLSKQLIFCDNVNMHHIVKLALISYCGVKAAKIGIINAQTLPDGTPSKPDTEHMQEVQDSFNGDEGFTVVIANKKAETGIDLQKGTQAIHHLTTGWTPDSVTQRNGRGLRQGNKQAEVRVYMYNANGTFDEYKQRTLANKSDWIDTLMQKGGDVAGTLIVEQELSNDDYDEMIQADTPEAMAAISQRRDDRLKQQRKETTAKKTAMMIRMVSQTAAIAKDSNTAARAVKKALIDHLTAIDALAKRIAKGADEKDALLALCNEVAFFGIDPEKMTDWLIGRLNSGKFDVDTLMRSRSAYASSNTPKLYEYQGYDYLLKNEDHPLHQKAKMTIESAQRMAAAAREDFVNFEDSALSRDEREAIADGQAIYTDGIVWRQGGLVVHSGSMGYGLSRLNTNFKGVLSVGMIRLIPTDPEYSEPKSTNPSGWQPIAPEQKQAAIDALAAWDAQQMEKNKISTVPEGRDIYYFSQLNDQVRMVAEQRAAASLADWLTQSTVIALDTIFIEGDGGNEHYYWHDEALPLTRLKNLKHVPLVNLPFAGLLTIADGVATIENRDFHKVSRGWGGADEHLANILRACEVVNKPIYLEPSEYVPIFDVTTTRVRRDFNAKELSVNLHWHILDYAKANNIDMAEKTTPISEDDATKIVISALEKLLKGMVSNCAELVAHLMQDAACKVVLLAGFVIKKTTDSVAASVAAVDLAALAVNGYVGMKSTQGANEKTNILRVYKEAIKAYCADEVGKKAKWDGKAEMWNYPVEVLTWLYGQSWYNAAYVQIVRATK